MFKARSAASISNGILADPQLARKREEIPKRVTITSASEDTNNFTRRIRDITASNALIRIIVPNLTCSAFTVKTVLGKSRRCR
jgi:hypothetical protein